ncbi:hypothetical protein [Saccharopolyspora kobensis]|nr:hypothetical protein [Saccharopolyspora kobensis]
MAHQIAAAAVIVHGKVTAATALSSSCTDIGTIPAPTKIDLPGEHWMS